MIKKRLKQTLLGIFTVCSIIGMSWSVYAYTPSFRLKDTTFTYELGKPISKDIKHYVDFIFEKPGVTLSIPEMNQVGKYKGKIEYRTFVYPFTIVIEDTTKPEFKDLPDKIRLNQGETKEQLPKFTATDLSDVKVSIDDSKVNYNSPGNYTLMVVATDTSKNQTKKEIPVEIVEKKKEEKKQEEKTGEKQGGNISANTNDSYNPVITPNVTPTPQPTPPAPTIETVNYNAISIPGVTSLAAVTVGSSQAAVDAYDVCLMTEIAGTPGSGQPILLGGHNYKSLGGLPNAQVGGIITLRYNGQLYRYRITTSTECVTSGSDLTSTATGEDLLERWNGHDVLQIYTCYYTGNYRWMVKAERA